MNIEIKKITREIYFTLIAIIMALLALFWFFSHSFATINVVPKNAYLSIDNAPQRAIQSGIYKVNITPGLHTVTVEAEGYIGTSKSYDFRRGFASTMSLDLEAVPKPTLISGGGKLMTMGNNFNEIYYLGADNAVYKSKISLDDQGEISVMENQAVTDTNLKNINEITWSPDLALGLFRKTDSSVTLFDSFRYDFVHQTETPWGGKDVGSIAWSPDGSKIAYYYAPSTGERSIIFADTHNTTMTRALNLAELSINDPIIHWSPDSEWLLIIPRNKDYESNKIYLFDAYTRTIKTLSDTGDQTDAIFSPDGNKVLYSTYSQTPNNPYASVLSVMNRDGSNKESLNIRADLSKVAWSKDSKNIVVATFNESTKAEYIFNYDVSAKSQTGFVIKNLDKIFIKSIAFSDDGKFVFYEANEGIFALKVQ